MKVLVVNSGSSSIKYQLFAMDDGQVLASGMVERIGDSAGRLVRKSRVASGEMTSSVLTTPVRDHREGIQQISASLADSGLLSGPGDLAGIGHRVAHGGEAFTKPTVIDAAVLEAIRQQSPLAPLHNPANIMGIEVTLSIFPGVPQVAVFDTAFHQTIPQHAYRYAIPHEIYRDHHVRRYGFHGTSHQYVARKAAEYLERPLNQVDLIVLHLGNGASAAAIQGGTSIDTSMGLTPLEGLIMGTRCGDIDPAMIFHLSRVTGKSNDELESLLNTRSGLKGICDENDMREVIRSAEAGDARAQLAIEMVAYRIKKYIGAYSAAIGGLDAVVFTGGIGEHSSEIRSRSCTNLSLLGIEIDPAKNELDRDGILEIQTERSPVKVLVVPTKEEQEIAVQTIDCILSAECPG